LRFRQTGSSEAKSQKGRSRSPLKSEKKLGCERGVVTGLSFLAVF
jgi:hypothetical protein